MFIVIIRTIAFEMAFGSQQIANDRIRMHTILLTVRSFSFILLDRFALARNTVLMFMIIIIEVAVMTTVGTTVPKKIVLQ